MKEEQKIRLIEMALNASIRTSKSFEDIYEKIYRTFNTSQLHVDSCSSSKSIPLPTISQPDRVIYTEEKHPYYKYKPKSKFEDIFYMKDLLIAVSKSILQWEIMYQLNMSKKQAIAKMFGEDIKPIKFPMAGCFLCELVDGIARIGLPSSLCSNCINWNRLAMYDFDSEKASCLSDYSPFSSYRANKTPKNIRGVIDFLEQRKDEIKHAIEIRENDK